MKHLQEYLPLGLLLSLFACQPPTSTSDVTPVEAPPPAKQEHTCEPLAPGADVFERAPGGVPEVSVEWVRKYGCQTRLLDIREHSEYTGPEGHIAGIEWIPMGQLTKSAITWDPTVPIVLVCRSGRRSARAVRLLEELGFRSVASMTGGMLAWGLAGNERELSPAARTPVRPSRTPDELEGPLTAENIRAHLGDPAQLRRVKVAALMLHGQTACVDGRDDHAVLGTPGGDMGELLLALTVYEQTRKLPLGREELHTLFVDHTVAFGDFYMHTDTQALEQLRDALVRHPIADLKLAADASIEEVLGAVLRPPRKAERELLELLVKPEFVGCGHLKLILEHPDEYRVRSELARELIAVFFRELWGGERRLHYVVLDGEHHEGAVLTVEVPNSIHAYTRVPAIPPRYGGRTMFVYHPQVATFIREQQAQFFAEHDVLQGLVLDDFRAQLKTLAHSQLKSTLGYLAPDLPLFTVRVGPDTIEVHTH